MPSQSKLIKKGLQYTDKLFDEIIRQLSNGVRSSDTLEEFLAKTSEYTSNNPLQSTGYDNTMLNLILAETNNHRFSRPAQRELTRVVIRERVGALIQDVGEDIKNSVKGIVTEEYNNPKGSNPMKMAKRISSEVDGIKNKRAKTIARTEIARTSTISEYVIAKEEGATHFNVTCRSTRCSLCKEKFCKSSVTGGDVEYGMDEVDMLPPLHPNCRCVANFYKKEGTEPTDETPTTTTTTETIEEPVRENTVYQLNNRENSYSDVRITKEQFDKVVKHQSKRAKAKLEFGNSIDNETGNLIHAKDIRGKKNRVGIPTHYKPYSVIHNHTNNGGFSGGDVYSHVLGINQEVCYATTPNGVWIMRDTRQGTFSKREGFVSENTASELKYRMEGKFREISNEAKAKYQEAYDNTSDPDEKEKIRQQLNNEAFENYNNWILEEFAVGKRMDWLIEIEFIPKEKLKDVQF